jgi:hypothetical protein
MTMVFGEFQALVVEEAKERFVID